MNFIRDRAIDNLLIIIHTQKKSKLGKAEFGLWIEAFTKITWVSSRNFLPIQSKLPGPRLQDQGRGTVLHAQGEGYQHPTSFGSGSTPGCHSCMGSLYSMNWIQFNPAHPDVTQWRLFSKCCCYLRQRGGVSAREWVMEGDDYHVMTLK